MNPLIVMMLVPLFTLGIYPHIGRFAVAAAADVVRNVSGERHRFWSWHCFRHASKPARN